ncbi:hypothetical protein [uncultured Sphingomonas sp.]|uniref:hypothetical protein n=1 Tax=uncultured Sphingomonas sp. TaxID=158754 RepID=UPI0025E3B2B8|nr:hypothetical protein [uncultured Sphingomonas sp.]
MSVALPTFPAPTEPTTPRYVEWGGTLRPVFGGAVQKLLRLGDRFAIDVTMPPMEIAIGMLWVSRLIAAQREGALLKWPTPGFNPGDPGNPMVNGAGQSGSQILLRGFKPGYAVREGLSFFSIIHGGRRYLHQALADRVADASGVVLLPIAPMLRIQPANGAVCEFATPMIEGFPEKSGQEWSPTLAAHVGLAFSIMENR